MTAEEMHHAVNIEVQQVASFVNDDFEPEEIDHYLNKAQDDATRERAIVAKFKKVSGGINATLGSLDEIRTLVAEQVLIPVIDATLFPEGDSNEYLVPYPDDYWMFLYSESGITRSANPEIEEKVYVRNIEISHFQISQVRVTPFHSPYLKYPHISIGEDFFHIFADVDTSIEDQKLIYVRYPLRIKWHPDNLPEENTDCELPDEVHNEVVERAVSLMKNDIPSRTNPPVVPVQPQ